jgi:hypothetical protein
VYSAVGAAVDDAESVSEVKDGGMAFPKANVEGLSHSGGEVRVCRRAIFPANLVHERMPCSEMVFDNMARGRGQGNISGMNIW